MSEDLKKQYSDLVIKEYYDKPSAAAEISAMASVMVKSFLFLKSFQKEFDLTHATGDRLDILGRVVGVNRTVINGIERVFFGFSGTPSSDTFSKAPLVDSRENNHYTDTQLTDNQMRFYIKAKAIKNAVAAYISHETKISLQSAILNLFDSSAYLVDNNNMSMTVYIDETVPLSRITLIRALGVLPSPQGVRMFIVRFYRSGTFGFSGNKNAKTFGHGRLASLI